jgi:hypothetical protein
MKIFAKYIFRRKHLCWMLLKLFADSTIRLYQIILEDYSADYSVFSFQMFIPAVIISVRKIIHAEFQFGNLMSILPTSERVIGHVFE